MECEVAPKKPRADSALKTLPLELQREVADRLDRESQRAVRTWLKAAHGVETSQTALTEFYQWWHAERQLESYSQDAARFRDTLKQMQLAGELDVSDIAISDTAQAYFELRTMQANDAHAYSAVKARRQRDRELAIRERMVADRERRTAILEQKAAQADRALGIMQDNTLNESQRIARMRECFLIG